jgi:hypothetical protein
MTKNTGGPAFPFTCEKYHSEGMTLRDYFAAKALQGQLSMPEVLAAISAGDTTVAALCGSCFEWADAMLEARKA